jgi:hypothetical protein
VFFAGLAAGPCAKAIANYDRRGWFRTLKAEHLAVISRFAVGGTRIGSSLMTPKLAIALSFTASAALIATAAVAQNVSEGGRKFTTELTGEAEVTAAGVPNQGDLDGTGTANVTVNVGQQRVCWDIDVDDIGPPQRGHIHRGAATTTGPIVVGFFEPADIDLNGCTTTPLDRALLKEIIQHPERFYVNVHNTEFPAGALRGQLSK